MKLIKLLSLLSNIWIVNSYVCSNPNYYISDQNSLNLIENCSTINGNLIINSGYNIDYFGKLKKLETINGYLNMIDNHNISTLYGFNNLKNVNGNQLYLNTYSVVIKYNINENNDTHEGLCYSDNIFWNNITQHPVDIRNNGINCPDCHSECVGCWGPGPNSCQFCLNFNYNGTCVPHCPSGYNGNICNNVLPSPPILNGNIYDLNNINISWDFSNPNDFVSGYKIWINGSLNYTYQNSDLGYYYYELEQDHIFDDLDYNTEYNIEVSFINQLGESNKSNMITLLTDHIPTTPTTTQTSTVTSTQTSTQTTTQTSTVTTTKTSTITSTKTSTPSTTITTSPTTTPSQSTTQTTTRYDSYNNGNIEDSNKDWNNLYIIPIVGVAILILVGVYLLDKKFCNPESTSRVSPDNTNPNSRGLNNNIYSSNNLGNVYNNLSRPYKPNKPNNHINTYNNLRKIQYPNVNHEDYATIRDNRVMRTFQNNIYGSRNNDRTVVNDTYTYQN